MSVVREKLPSKSVVVPVSEPLKYTFAKGTGSPEPASVTLPVTVVRWACAEKQAEKRAKNRNTERKLLFTGAKVWWKEAILK